MIRETKNGAEFITDLQVRHVMRYVQAMRYLPEGGLVLDAACGTGYGTKILSRNHDMLGLDNDEDALREALQRAVNGCNFIHGDIRDGKWFADNLDAIVSIETIEHFDQVEGWKILKNFHTWLKDKGVLIISTPYCKTSGPSPVTKTHLWEYCLTDLEMSLTDAGFAIEFIKTERETGKAGRLGYCMVKAIKR